jgi:hypothetical protein
MKMKQTRPLCCQQVEDYGLKVSDAVS